jgi:hypothetical protein
MDHYLAKVAVDQPISISFASANVAGDLTPYSHMVKLFSHGPQTTLDIIYPFTVGQLSESHA